MGRNYDYLRQLLLLLLGCVALVRGRVGYSDQTFPWTICRSDCLSSALLKNGRSDLDAVWHRTVQG